MIKFRHNIMNVSTMNTFLNIKGGLNCECKDVYFVRAVGATPSLASEIEKNDAYLSGKMRPGLLYYKRITELPKQLLPETVSLYSELYDKWQSGGKTVLKLKTQASGEFSEILSQAMVLTLEKFRIGKSGVSESMEKNFAVKLMWWLDSLCEELIKQWNLSCSVKIIADNMIKRQEYLFFYMLTLIGCDVLLVQSKADIAQSEEVLGLSEKFRLGDFSDMQIPPYKAVKAAVPEEKPSAEKRTPINAVHPNRPQPRPSVQESVGRPSPVNIVHPNRSAPRSAPVREAVRPQTAASGQRTEKTFEELAKLASSVVMIAICDVTGKAIGTGSGIMIGRDGYILTNNHVASGGRFYSVRIEDDENYYDTDEIIKYNPMLDLAIIRIQRKLDPIPVYNGKQGLARGQKVVAIGSPMGLFNSVSDGIISGFRTIRDVDMIQFTAPISHGSSGGAVLNMYGEVIGISTAGIDEGQNLNLAMGYECINDFIRGFI